MVVQTVHGFCSNESSGTEDPGKDNALNRYALQVLIGWYFNEAPNISAYIYIYISKEIGLAIFDGNMGMLREN